MCDYKITRNDCIAVMRQHRPNTDFEIIDYDEKSLSGQVDGIMAGHFRLHIKVKVNHIISDQTFFVKRMRSAIEIQNKMIQQQQVYEKEAFMYAFLDKVGQLEPKYNLDFTANCYFTVANDLFILEDLSVYGYIVNKSKDFQLDIDQLILTMDSTAKYHAASIIYETKQDKPYKITDEYSAFLKEPLFRRDENYLGNKLLKSGVAAVLALMDLMPQLKEESKKKFLENVEKIYDLVKPSKFQNVICHGDLWSNNLMFKYAQDKPVHCKIIDFQALRYTAPALDVLAVLYFTFDNNFIRNNKNVVYRAYYSSLKKYLDESGIDINNHMTWNAFEESLNYMLPFAIIQKITLCPMIAMAFDEELKTDPIQFENFMYGNKTDICVRHYKNNPYFKMVMDSAIERLDEL